jgi:peptidoglycan/xylan/chitin deacetylase (PgdA/CDA1 family)
VHWRIPPLRLALWTSSLAGVLCAVRALVLEPLPLHVAVVGLLAQALLATVGVLLPSLGAFADVYSRGPRERPEVALTFDDGPHPDTTPRVLELLREHGAQATFFVLGEKALAHPELVRAAARAGHAIGVHGHRHERSYALRGLRFVERDLALACEAVERATGVRPELFRPPIGFVSGNVALAAERARLTLVGFSARTGDGLASARSDRVLERATAELASGAILVLHDAAERGEHVPASIAVLGELLARLRRKGLVAVSVDALRRPL